MAFRSSADSFGPMYPFSTTYRLSPDTAGSGGFSGGVKLRSSVSPWVRFTWPLASVPAILPGAPSPDIIRSATSEESEKVLDVILQSLSMDSAWNDSMVKIGSYLKEAVARVFAQEEPLCLVIPKGNRFIAASLLDPSADASNQLLSGPVALVEYRNRGIGTRLLHASLLTLRDRGLSTASGVTRINTVASSHVYPKFGGLAEAIEFPSRAEISSEAKS